MPGSHRIRVSTTWKSHFHALRPNQTILAGRVEMKPSTGEGVWALGVLEELGLGDPSQAPETPPKETGFRLGLGNGRLRPKEALHHPPDH